VNRRHGRHLALYKAGYLRWFALLITGRDDPTVYCIAGRLSDRELKIRVRIRAQANGHRWGEKCGLKREIPRDVAD